MTAFLFLRREKSKMTKRTKLTLQELLRRKEQMLEAKKIKSTKELYIASIDATITIEEPDSALCRDAMGMDDSDADKYMCYECIKEPNLKSKDVQEAFGCAEPMDIVEAIFKPGEIPQIAVACLKLAGFAGGVEAVKN